MKYKKILLKLSGEVLAGKNSFGIEENALMFYVNEISEIVEKGIQVAIVIGGGNIFRGASYSSAFNIDQPRADYMGMLATVINGIALNEAFRQKGFNCKHITAFEIQKIGEIYNHEKALQYFDSNNIIIFTGGTGNPLFTTDSAAALRAIELNCDLLIKGTKVDGVFSADPLKYQDAIKYNTASFDEVIEKNLKVMDTAAFALCREHKMPVVVYNANIKGNLLKIIESVKIGTLIS